MSIVTLRSSEDFGAATSDSAAAVNFQNFFKDPIYFNKDDQIQVTSVTINQEIKEVVVTELDNTLNYMLFPAKQQLNDIPFFERHQVFLTPGTYTPAALAVEVAKQLNDSVILQCYNFQVTFDTTATPPGFKIEYNQLVVPGASNTGVQGIRFDGSGKNGGKGVALNTPQNFAEIPLVPVAAGANNVYSIFFNNLNNSLESPTKPEQLALLTPANYNKQLIKPFSFMPPTNAAGPGPVQEGTSLITGCNFQYIFNKGIYANGGTHEINIAPTLTLDNINLMISADNAAVKDYVRISNDGAPGVTNIYEVTAPGVDSLLLVYDYELQNVNDFQNKPTAVQLQQNALVPPTTAITGINNSANNTISANGTGYVAGSMYNAGVVPSDPTKEAIIVHVKTINATGGITAFEVITPGDGYVVGDVITVSGTGTAASGGKITVGTGGLRTDTAGTNNAPLTALTVGNSYKAFFPFGVMANPTAGGPSFPAPQFSELTGSSNEINMLVKIDSIDATTRKVTGVSLTSVGLDSTNADFTRLKNIIQNTTKNIGLVDNNGSFTSVSTSIVQITASRSAADVAAGVLKFASRPDGLSGLGSSSVPAGVTPAYPQNPLPTANGGNGTFDSGIFTAFEDFEIPPATGTFRACINTKSITSLKEIDPATGELVTNGKIIEKLLTATLAPIPLTGTAQFARLDFRLGFLRNQARENYEGPSGTPAEKIKVLEYSDILLETFNAFVKRRKLGFGESSAVETTFNALNGIVTTLEYDSIATEPGSDFRSRDIIFANNLKAGAGFQPETPDKIAFVLDRLNQLTITYSQPTNPGFTPVVITLANNNLNNHIKENIFPLCPIFAMSAGVPINRANPAGGGAADQITFGGDYDIQGRYDIKEVPVQSVVRTSAGVNGGNPYNNIFYPTVGGGLIPRFQTPTDRYTFFAQGAGGNTDMLRLPLVYTFGTVAVENIDATNANPRPVGAVGKNVIGFTQAAPDGTAFDILGMGVVENLTALADESTNPLTLTSTSQPAQGLPPSMVVELPDFNILGYSGAAADKFKIVATIPTEEWSTGITNGVLHYKPLFPLSIDVNLPEDRELYSITVRLRNLDGTLAKNLKNPTTLTFYKKPHEGRAFEKLIDRALQSRSENQDQQLATLTDQFPRV